MQASYERHLFQSGWLAEQGETWASLAASRKCLKMKAGRYARGIFINMYSILYQQLLDTYWNLYTPEENNLGSLLKKKSLPCFSAQPRSAVPKKKPRHEALSDEAWSCVSHLHQTHPAQGSWWTEGKLGKYGKDGTVWEVENFRMNFWPMIEITDFFKHQVGC